MSTNNTGETAEDEAARTANDNDVLSAINQRLTLFLERLVERHFEAQALFALLAVDEVAIEKREAVADHSLDDAPLAIELGHAKPFLCSGYQAAQISNTWGISARFENVSTAHPLRA